MELSEISQESGETVSTFSSHLRANVLRISDGGLEIPPILISMIMVRGLESRYDELKKQFTANAKESWGWIAKK